jgi:multisubunit Na+/H+ antiporter MnhB subunit
MRLTLPVLLSLVGAVGAFSFSFRLRRLKVSTPLRGLSVEQRRRKLRIASWMFIGLSFFWLAAAFYFAWLEKAN